MPRAKTLTVTRPSPSTTAYTVSNASTPRSSFGLLFHRLALASRGCLAVLCVFIVIGRWRAAISALSTTDTNQLSSTNAGLLGAGKERGIFRILELSAGSWLGEGSVIHAGLSQRFGNVITAWLPILVAITAIWLLSRRGYVEEQLLLLRSLGLQTSTSSPYHLLAPTTRFIPTSQIRDILIHEAFRGFEVRYYLVVIVEGEQEAIVVFGKVLPRRDVLEEVWRGARSVLWGKEGRKNVITAAE